MIESILGLGAGLLVLIFIVWLIPIILIASSSKTTGLEKALWIVLMLFFSWFSWILYLIIAPVEKKEN